MKMNGWKTTFLLGRPPLYFQGRTACFRECIPGNYIRENTAFIRFPIHQPVFHGSVMSESKNFALRPRTLDNPFSRGLLGCPRKLGTLRINGLFHL